MDPHELPAAQGLEPVDRRSPLLQRLELVESLVVAKGLGIGGLTREAGGSVARRLQGLGQGEQRLREMGLPVVEHLMLPGAQPGEQRSHGRDAEAGRRDRPAGPARAAEQRVEVWRQPRLTAEVSHHVRAQRVEGNEHDGPSHGRLAAVARGQEEPTKKESRERTAQRGWPHPTYG